MTGAAVVILGAGSGSRVGAGINKILLPLAGQPVLARSVRTALSVRGVGAVVVVHRAGERADVGAALLPVIGERDVLLVEGGASRQDSEQAALAVLAPQVSSGEIDVIAIHDGARPLAGVELFEATIAAAQEYGGAVPTHDLPGLLPRTAGTAPVSAVAGVATPQAFRAAPLLAAYAAAREAGFDGTDTAAAFAQFAPADLVVRAVPGGPGNLKVTFAEDLRVAERLLG